MSDTAEFLYKCSSYYAPSGERAILWNDPDIGIDWPIRYKDIEPWYDYVESFAGISGEPLGLSYLPDGKFQPGMELNAVEKLMRERIQQNFPGRYLTIARVAILARSRRP